MQPIPVFVLMFSRMVWLSMGFLLFGVAGYAQKTKSDSVFGGYNNIDPEFPGGTKAMIAYLKHEVNYPDSAAKAGVLGKVYVSFIIDANGRISKPVVLKSLDYGCDQEAIRIINAMPLWVPGKRWSGEPIPVRYNLPIWFGPR